MATTRAIFENIEKEFEDMEKATCIAVHYLLSEFAFFRICS